MLFNRIVNLALSAALIFAVGGSIGPGWCAEAATQEQNLALLKRIEADLAKKPNDQLLNLQHAELMGLLGRFDEQVAEANNLIKKNPKLVGAYVIRADGEANQMRYSDAILTLDLAFKLSAPSPDLLLFKSNCLKNEERYKEAIEILNEVIEAQPANFEAYKCRSVCYFRAYGACVQALKDMEKVVLLNPSDKKAKTVVASLKRELDGKAATGASLNK